MQFFPEDDFYSMITFIKLFKESVRKSTTQKGASRMFRLLKNRISKKEEELKYIKSRLKQKNLKARCGALMRFQPLKIEIAELKSYLLKKILKFRKKRSSL